MADRDPKELLFIGKHMRGRMCYILLKGLRDPDLIVRKKEIDVACERLLTKMTDLGLLIKIKPRTWRINIPMLQRCSYVVSDKLFDELSSPQNMWIMREKLKGRDRTPEDYQLMVKRWSDITRARRIEQLKGRKAQANKGDDSSADPLSLENILFPPNSK